MKIQSYTKKPAYTTQTDTHTHTNICDIAQCTKINCRYLYLAIVSSNYRLEQYIETYQTTQSLPRTAISHAKTEHAHIGILQH